MNVAPATLEPTTGVISWNLLQLGVGETLARVNRAGHVEPWLAQSFRMLNELEWEITLRDNAKFHDGKAVDAPAVKRSLERMIARVPQAASLVNAAAVTATGSSTVVIKTKAPNPVLGSSLAHFSLLVHDADAAEAKPDQFAAAPNLTGSFKVSDFRKDAGLKLLPHAAYWGEPARVGMVDVRFLVDASARTNALLGKQVDMAYQIPHEVLEQVEKTPGLLVKSVTTGYQYFIILNTTRPQFSDPTVRRALSLAVDRNALVQRVLRGGAEPARSAFSTIYPFALKTGHGFELDKAKAALDGAGWRVGSDGVRVKDGARLAFTLLTYPQRPELGQVGVALQAQLKEAGAAVELRSVDNINDALKDPTFDASLYAVNTAPTADPGVILNQFYKSNGTSNFGRFSAREIDDSITQLNGTTDETHRAALVQKIQQDLLEASPHIYLVVPKFRVGLTDRLKSYEPFPSDYHVVDSSIQVSK